MIARTRLTLPPDMAPGPHRIGIAVRDLRTGLMLPPSTEAGAKEVAAALLLTSAEVVVVSPEEAEAAAWLDRQQARALLEEGQCEQGWRAWKDALLHLGRTAWDEKEALEELGGCYAARAAVATERDAQLAALLEGLRWAPRQPALRAQALPLAAMLDDEGDRRAAAGDWDAAFVDWDTAVRLEPGRAWTRRKAERARDLRAPTHPAAAKVGGMARAQE